MRSSTVRTERCTTPPLYTLAIMKSSMTRKCVVQSVAGMSFFSSGGGSTSSFAAEGVLDPFALGAAIGRNGFPSGRVHGESGKFVQENAWIES
ncbi:MAG: hypothetical protein L6V35_04650 [Alistipes putredinis]|nr:MAG: hypothetical protein L6V35_04650 [Alistipes putredinis]